MRERKWHTTMYSRFSLSFSCWKNAKFTKANQAKDGKLLLSWSEESGAFDELWAKKRK